MKLTGFRSAPPRIDPVPPPAKPPGAKSPQNDQKAVAVVAEHATEAARQQIHLASERARQLSDLNRALSSRGSRPSSQQAMDRTMAASVVAHHEVALARLNNESNTEKQKQLFKLQSALEAKSVNTSRPSSALGKEAKQEEKKHFRQQSSPPFGPQNQNHFQQSLQPFDSQKNFLASFRKHGGTPSDFGLTISPSIRSLSGDFGSMIESKIPEGWNPTTEKKSEYEILNDQAKYSARIRIALWALSVLVAIGLLFFVYLQLNVTTALAVSKAALYVVIFLGVSALVVEPISVYFILRSKDKQASSDSPRNMSQTQSSLMDTGKKSADKQASSDSPRHISQTPSSLRGRRKNSLFDLEPELDVI